MYKKLLPLTLAFVLAAPSAFAIDTNTGNNPISLAPSADSICFFNNAAFVLRICDMDFANCTDVVGGKTIKVNISHHLQKYGEAHFTIQGILRQEPFNITLRRTGDTVHVRGDALFSKLIFGMDAGTCK